MSKSCGHLSLRPTYRTQGGICTNCEMLCCPKCFYYENENGLFDELDGLCGECNEEKEEMDEIESRKKSARINQQVLRGNRESRLESYEENEEEEEEDTDLRNMSMSKNTGTQSRTRNIKKQEEEEKQECPKCKKQKKPKRSTSKYLDFYCKQCKVGWRDLKDESEEEDESEHASDIEILEEEEVQNPFEVMCEMKTGKIKIKIRLENKITSLKNKLIEFIKKRDPSLQQYTNESFKLICNNKVLIDDQTIKESKLTRFSVIYIYVNV